MIKLLFGIFIGSAITVIAMSLLAIAKNTEPPKGKPAKLWLSGNVCKYKGEEYTIIAMTPGDHQTWALLENDQGETIAPIEELEAMEE